MDQYGAAFSGYVKSLRWRTIWAPLVLVAMFAVVGQARASAQENPDQLPDTVQADLSAVNSTDMEIEKVDCELRAQEQNRTSLLQRLQEARARDKKNCAPQGAIIVGTRCPRSRLATWRGLAEGLLEEERATLNALRHAGYGPEHPEIKRAERVIQELQALGQYVGRCNADGTPASARKR